MTQPTQVRRPWRATVRTIVQLVVSLAAAAPLIYAAVTNSSAEQATGAAAVLLSVAAAITRVMALPVVEQVLRSTPWLSWLAADPNLED